MRTPRRLRRKGPQPAADGRPADAADRRWWPGRLVDALLADAVQASPAEVAVVDRDRRATYAEVDRAVRSTAAALHGLGVRRGDVVSFQLPNWLEAYVVHYATVALGAISNPIVPIYRERELGFILRQAASRVIVVPETFRGCDHAAMLARLRAGLPDLEHVLVVGDPPPGTTALADVVGAADGTAPPPVARDPGDPALLLYTSGTEADPKGVLHSHDTLVYEAQSIVDLYRLDGDDRILMPSPVTHITGVLYGLLMPAMLRTRVVLQDVWAPGAALTLIERERCSVIIGATPFLHGLASAPELAERDVRSLRVFGCGGADVAPELIRSASERLGCRASRLYGSSECPTVSGTPIDDTDEHHAMTDGRPIGGARARVVDVDGRELPAGSPGELVVRGPELFIGYLDPALNARAFDADGWFRTGDLATMDEDGYLRILGRAKDVIVRGGENISAKEVEDLLAEHPDVVEVAIVAMPDPVLVERACAFVVPRPGTTPTLAELVAFLREQRLAAQKLPERLELVDELVKTASGKVQKYRLREEIARRIREEAE